MPKVVPFRVVRLADRANCDEAAALWLARLDRGLVPEERAALARWLAEAPRHRAALLEMAKLWDQMGVLAELGELFPLGELAVAPPRRRGGRRLALGAAAALVGAAIALAWLVRDVRAPDGKLQTHTPFARHYSTAVGVQSTEPLPDGSMLALNTDTDVEVAFTAEERNVFLHRGEAHFVVAHDERHPFRVYVGARVVQAVGTAFNVHYRPGGDVEVTVTDGRVRVTDRQEDAGGAPHADYAAGSAEIDTMIVEGEALLLDDAAALAQAAPLVLEPVQIDIKLAWQRGMLIFQGEPLATVLAEVGRYTTTRFDLGDSSLGTVRVGGYFRAGDIDGLLVALRENFHIQSTVVDPDRIVLTQAP